MSLTEGEWTYFPEKGDDDGGEVWAVRDGGSSRQHVASNLNDDNGRLIAAAPKMLDLLKRARHAAKGHLDLEEQIWDLLVSIGEVKT
jgi:hypothetical protein